MPHMLHEMLDIKSNTKKKIGTEVKKINDKTASNSSEVLLYNNRLKQVKDRKDDLDRYASEVKLLFQR